MPDLVALSFHESSLMKLICRKRAAKKRLSMHLRHPVCEGEGERGREGKGEVGERKERERNKARVRERFRGRGIKRGTKD